MGMRFLLVALVALALAAPAAAGVSDGATYLRVQQNADGGFGEPREPSDVALTAWVSLGLLATGREPRRREAAADYLVGVEDDDVTDLALRILALDAYDRGVLGLADRLAAQRRSNGRIGSTVNSTVWSVLALRAAGRPAGRTTVRYLLRQQRPGGGWSWAPGGSADSNDTAAAIQALRAAGIPTSALAVRRGVAYLRGKQNRDGGFELAEGRGSDAQSTAWAIQALVAARARLGTRPFRYLQSLQRPNGSFRYSKEHGVTPVWVTAQVLPALARRPFPLP
jgi:prenyltransferase beta subunit